MSRTSTYDITLIGGHSITVEAAHMSIAEGAIQFHAHYEGQTPHHVLSTAHVLRVSLPGHENPATDRPHYRLRLTDGSNVYVQARFFDITKGTYRFFDDDQSDPHEVFAIQNTLHFKQVGS